MVREFFSFLTGKIFDDLSKLLGMVESIFTPPKLFDNLVLEELSQIGNVGLLSEGILEELNDISRLEFGENTDIFLSLGVMDQQHEGVLVLIVQLRAQIEAALNEELLGVFSRGGGDPPIVLFS